MPDVIDVLRSLRKPVSSGGEIIAKQRKKIRDIVGELGDHLNRAFWLVDLYLDGAKPIRYRTDLAAYLWDAHDLLRASFNDYQVCSGIRQLAAECKQVLDTTGYAVAIGQSDNWYALIEALEYGEGMGLENLNRTRAECSQFGDRIDQVNDNELAGVREQLFRFIERTRRHQGRRCKKINHTIESIVHTMYSLRAPPQFAAREKIVAFDRAAEGDPPGIRPAYR